MVQCHLGLRQVTCGQTGRWQSFNHHQTLWFIPWHFILRKQPQAFSVSVQLYLHIVIYNQLLNKGNQLWNIRAHPGITEPTGWLLLNRTTTQYCINKLLIQWEEKVHPYLIEFNYYSFLSQHLLRTFDHHLYIWHFGSPALHSGCLHFIAKPTLYLWGKFKLHIIWLFIVNEKSKTSREINVSLSCFPLL